jgi:hypothetical protein
VEVFAEGADLPALDTRFLDLDPAVPPADVVAFTPPPEATLLTAPRHRGADRAGRGAGAGRAAARELAGLPRRTVRGGARRGRRVRPRGDAAGGRAGAGPAGRGLREALTASPDAVTDELGTRVAAGPLGLMLVDPGDGPAYVLTGTVTLDALADAARRLPGAAS